jgi:hypothetical protein
MDWIQVIWLLVGFLFGVTVLRALFPFAHRFGLKARFWLRHSRKGKFVLFVYSDSSNWKDHIETHILPHIEPHSVILNWSKRREWESRMRFEMKVFDQWAGSNEFTPTAILFPSLGSVKVIRLWHSSPSAKHGKDKRSKESERDLLAAVNQLGGSSYASTQKKESGSDSTP